jgi:hypothetical protein
MRLLQTPYNASEQLRFVINGSREADRQRMEGSTMDWKRITLAAMLVAALAALPFSSAEAYWRHRGGPGFWPFWAGAALVGTAAAVATAPLRAWPYYYYPPAPYYYAPPPAYYAPSYYPYYR